MKVPASNNTNGFESYDEETYYTEGTNNHAPTTNGNAEEYSPPVQDSDFSEYMWMENEEEFDKEVLQRLEEEELMEQCMLQHMLDDDRTSAQTTTETNGVTTTTTTTTTQTTVNGKTEVSEMAKSSTLNPHAAEFVPSWGRAATTETKSS